jgi:hypothetical protein
MTTEAGSRMDYLLAEAAQASFGVAEGAGYA